MASDLLKNNLSGVLGAQRTVGELVNGAVPGTRGNSATDEQFSQLTQQLQQLQTVAQTETQILEANTQAVNQNTTQLGQSGSSVASRVGSTIGNTLGLMTGLSPLITGLIGLFGGGGSSQPAAPASFVLPPSVSVSAGFNEATPTQAFAADFASGGNPRPEPAPAATVAPQITVQVQAMDSQSFLDRSQDIAAAVRQAMLESGVLNDVIREA